VRVVAVVAIAAAFAAAAYALQRQTVARGTIVADDILREYHVPGWRAVACPPEIPIGVDGARFTCELELEDGAVVLAVHLRGDGAHELCLERVKSGTRVALPRRCPSRS
jgi:hypothetical protein